MKIAIDLRMVKRFQTGIGNYQDNITFNLIQIDKKNHYILIHNDDEVINRLKEKYRDHQSVSIYKINAGPATIKQYLILEGTLRKLNPDILITDIITAPILYNKNIHISIHDIIYEHFPQYANLHIKAFYKILMPYLLRKAKKVITVSKFSQKDISKRFNIKNNKFIITYNAIDSKVFYKCKKSEVEKIKKKFKIKGNYYISVGNIRPHKNIKTLLKAFETLKDIKETNEELIIVGDVDASLGNNYREQLIENINKNKYKQYIKRLGHISKEDLTILLGGSIALVHPSLFEGFGLTPLEAMACHTAVISSNAASLPEVIGDAGLMFDPLNIEALSKKMQLISKDKKLRDNIIKKGTKRVEDFSWYKSAQALHKNLKK